MNRSEYRAFGTTFAAAVLGPLTLSANLGLWVPVPVEIDVDAAHVGFVLVMCRTARFFDGVDVVVAHLLLTADALAV